MLSEVCTNVSVNEPSLQELSGETLSGRSANKDNDARDDIAMNGFWGHCRERMFADTRASSPLVFSYRQTAISSSYKVHEKEKKRQYGQRIREIEHGTFTPLVNLFINRWNGQGGNRLLQEVGLPTI